MTAPSKQGEELGVVPIGAREGFVAGAQPGVQQDLLGGCSGYGAIYADPPWRFDLRSEKGKSRSPDEARRVASGQGYATMSIDEIAALPVGAIAGSDCVLFMWVINSMIPDALRLGTAWGFRYKTLRVWAKTRVAGFDPSLTLDQNFPMGTGYIVRGNPELMLVFTRGAPRFRTAPRALVIAPRREHSRKPDEIRTDIERQVDGPYIELFARTAAPGWDAWGNQVGRFAYKSGAAA